MKNLLIGSRALNFWFPDHKIKESTDWDIISDKPFEDIPEGVNYEWHDPDILLNSELENYTWSTRFVEFKGQRIYVVTPVGLAFVKRSHLWRDLGFDKHITHWNKHLQPLAQSYLQTVTSDDYLQRRTTATMQMFQQGHPKLNQTVEKFFDDAVTKKYSHDWLHELYAHHDKPLYTRLQTNPELAWCEKDKWDSFSFDDKIKCVQEEAYVIATERFLVPSGWDYPERLAYFNAVKKICTTLCSGWFRDFAIDNHQLICSSFDAQKVKSVVEYIQRNELKGN
jgi:hypothetical protein